MLVDGFQTRVLPVEERRQERKDKKDSFAATLEAQELYVNGSQLEMGKAAILNAVKESSTEAHVRRVEFNLGNIETKVDLQKYFYNMILRAQGLVLSGRY